MSDRARPLAPIVATDPSGRAGSDAAATQGSDDGPSSAVRPIDPLVHPRVLVVVTPLRGAAAQSAWVTITDVAGVVYFEGSLEADGTITASFEGAPAIDRVHVLLETSRGHRQAQVVLGAGRSEHRFE